MTEEEVNPLEFERILNSSVNERSAAAYLKLAPWIPYWTLCALGGHCRYALPEFPLGAEWKVDLLILNSYSGAWEAHFIEFEPVGDKILTRKRTPTKTFAIAIRQIDDWRRYFERNRNVVRADMVRLATKNDKLGYDTDVEPCNYSGDRLLDPSTVILDHYHIVIGRSTVLSPETRQLMGRYLPDHGVQVVSYDRFLQLTKRRYPL